MWIGQFRQIPIESLKKFGGIAMKGYSTPERWIKALTPNVDRHIYCTVDAIGCCDYYTGTIKQIIDLLKGINPDLKVQVELHADFYQREKYGLKVVDSAYFRGYVSRRAASQRPLHVSPRGRLYYLMPCPTSTRYCYRYWVE